MPNLQAAEDHLAEVSRITALAVLAGRRSVGKLDVRRLGASYNEVVAPELLVMLTAAQRAVASLADPYMDAALREQGLGDGGKVAQLVPGSLAGVASDGRPLPTLLRSPLIEARSVAATEQPTVVIRKVQSTVDRIVSTQVADANRAAESAVIATRMNVGGYVRQLTPPSCSRCAILAGRWYRYNQGFLRHPQCDCVHVPVQEDAAGDLTTNPRDYFDSLTPKQQDRIFTKSGAQAIRDGADMGQVVNARRGMRTVSGEQRRVLGARVTNEGITARGFAVNAPGSSVARRGGVRLMPEAIYELAKDRADAVRLLRANGYVRS